MRKEDAAFRESPERRCCTVQVWLPGKKGRACGRAAPRNVFFSGSVGGYQGEVGVSSAITAAGLASLFTQEPDTAVHAMALCLKNLLGLVCDPIAGPIEVPCIKRNAVGVANASV